MTQALLLAAHGSRNPQAHAAMEQVLAALARREGFGLAAVGYLSITPPPLATAIDRLASGGATKIYVLPYFLHAGRHVTLDVKRQIEEAQSLHPTLPILLAEAIGFHPALVDVLSDRLRSLQERLEPGPVAIGSPRDPAWNREGE